MKTKVDLWNNFLSYSDLPREERNAGKGFDFCILRQTATILAVKLTSLWRSGLLKRKKSIETPNCAKMKMICWGTKKTQKIRILERGYKECGETSKRKFVRFQATLSLSILLLWLFIHMMSKIPPRHEALHQCKMTLSGRRWLSLILSLSFWSNASLKYQI